MRRPDQGHVVVGLAGRYLLPAGAMQIDMTPGVHLSARRLATRAAFAAILSVLFVAPAATSAASSSVECGQLTGYTAPDPLAPADGTLQVGLADSWLILATAALSPSVESGLPTIVNSGPTCLALDLDADGKVAALDFAPSGSLSGSVSFDSGSGYYLFADRLIVPSFVTDANPGLAALFVTSEQAGAALSITFSVDTANGGFEGFDGHTTVCGKGNLTAGGDGKVGNATISGSFLDAGDRKALKDAGSRTTCATVHAVGTIDGDTGDITITTAVTIKVAAAGVTITPPPTSTESANEVPASSAATLLSWLAIVLATSVAVIALDARRRIADRTVR